MLDLLWGLIIIVVLSMICFRLALLITSRLPIWSCEVLAVITVAFLTYYTFNIRDETWLANYLPFSNIIILGNWYPLMAGFLSGLVWRRLPGKWYRKLPATVLLMGIGIYATVHPLIGDTPVCTNTWQADVCLQTSASTCSPAAVCTVLKSYKIEATEAEMAEKCLTFQRGSLWQGIYRGLKLKTEGTDYKVIPRNCTVDELKAIPRGQLVLSVELKKGTNYDPIYEEKFGWQPGQAHTVAYYGFIDDNTVLIADPSIGWERWSRKDLETLWHGQAFQLVER